MRNLRDEIENGILGVLRWLVSLSRPVKFVLLLTMDAMLCVLAVWISFLLRLGDWRLWNHGVGIVMASTLALWLPIFLWSGIYRSVVRFVGSRTMAGIARSSMLMVPILAVIFVAGQFSGVPRTIAVIQPLVFACLLMISRLVARYVLFDLLNQKRLAGEQKNVLIYGAGSAGRQLSLSLRHEPTLKLVGYVDDDPRLVGNQLDGVKIFENTNLAALATRHAIDMVVLALPGVSRRRREQIVHKFEGLNLQVMILPAMSNLLDGSVSVANLREIEISDILGRDPVLPIADLLEKTISGQRVMVTGSGGSIGSELCRQILQLNPKAIVLVEMTEHALYVIESELREAQKGRAEEKVVPIYAELGNISDKDSVARLFERWKPDSVFHAAAYKHVPLVEENVIAGMRNNIFGTLYCATEAERVGVRNFILISTDKAVRPTNVMGATKRVCELVLQALAARGSTTRFAMVRFGNVLGSSGSVVPRFQSQIRAGGPVTLTHRDVTRYFMTIPEAAQLVIQAGGMADGGEVFVLDMGEPIRIYDLASAMIRLSGLTLRDAANPDGDIEIHEVGLRKGEKLYEELLIGNSPRATIHPRIMQARETFLEWPLLSRQLDTMLSALAAGDRQVALTILCELVPEFQGEQSTSQTSALAAE